MIIMAKAKEKAPRCLLLVESPNKIKTFQQILPDNFIVQASVGHITQIADTGKYNLGIDVDNDFQASYKIMEGKSDIVKKLKEQVKLADIVYVYSDGDREGEAIAYHLVQQLKIPKYKCKRATSHEITKKAVLNAIENPRDLDYDLIAAATTRQKLDKIVGYRLSNIARKNVNARSVGRCQSAGLKIIVDREKEIQSFKSSKYFDLYLKFKKNGTDFKAKYQGTADKQIKNFPSLEACKKVVNDCKNFNYIISDIQTKDVKENPKPPFITSTFQQEVSKKLGIGIKSAMDCAQKLFEGIDVNGKHVSLITYIRTDSPTYAPEFLPTLEAFVKKTYGASYYSPVKFGKSSENSQEGHEGIRVVDLEMTPDQLSQYVHNDLLLKVYSIIYNRTVASAMKPAIIANTIYTISNNNHRFSMTSKELKFDGYRKVYYYNDPDDNSDDTLVKEVFIKDEILKDTSLEALEKETKPPARYDEASFIKELDKKGIGRPSTYASIINTILDKNRNYCIIEDKKIVPTDHGINLSAFLDKCFPSIISIEYTAKLEKDLDLIANGKQDNVEFLKVFYSNLEKAISDVQGADSDTNNVCPLCGASMKYRKGKFGAFLGCSTYPECKGIISLSNSYANKES